MRINKQFVLVATFIVEAIYLAMTNLPDRIVVNLYPIACLRPIGSCSGDCL